MRLLDKHETPPNASIPREYGQSRATRRNHIQYAV